MLEWHAIGEVGGTVLAPQQRAILHKVGAGRSIAGHEAGG